MIGAINGQDSVPSDPTNEFPRLGAGFFSGFSSSSFSKRVVKNTVIQSQCKIGDDETTR